MPEEPKVTTVSTCPVCGSTNRLAGDIAKEQGIANAEHYGLQAFGGPIIDKKKLPSTLIGSKVPVVNATVDVCTGIRDDGSVCGCVYAIAFGVASATLQAQPGRQVVPGAGPMPPGGLGPLPPIRRPSLQ